MMDIQKVWDALFTGKTHVEDLIAFEKAAQDTGFKLGVLKRQLREIEAAMQMVDPDKVKPSEAMIWDTIDKAPKDGTKVDLWEDGERYPDMFWGKPKLVWLNSEHRAVPYEGDGCWMSSNQPLDTVDEVDTWIEPSHFLLVNPPAKKGPSDG